MLPHSFDTESIFKLKILTAATQFLLFLTSTSSVIRLVPKHQYQHFISIWLLCSQGSTSLSTVIRQTTGFGNADVLKVSQVEYKGESQDITTPQPRGNVGQMLDHFIFQEKIGMQILFEILTLRNRKPCMSKMLI